MASAFAACLNPKICLTGLEAATAGTVGSPDCFSSQPLKSMLENLLPFISFTAPRQFRLPGQSLRRAAGHRAGAVFFARHLDYFIVTRNFTAIYLDLVPSRQFHRDPKLTAVYRDWQKTRHRDADGT